MSVVTEIKTVVIVGAGKLATQLGVNLIEKGFVVQQVYSRTLSSARALGEMLNCDYVDDIDKIYTKADLYIIAVSDNAISQVANSLFERIVDSLIVHTSGSSNIAILKSQSSYCGVLYLLQTFIKERIVNLSNTPIFIEAERKEDEERLKYLSQKLSNKVYILSSDERIKLHTAAVFACNFSNFMYTIADDILNEIDMDISIITPLIEETLEKVKQIKPKDSQTGPAIRKDTITIDKHIEILKEDILKQSLYKKITESIYEYYKLRSEKD